MMSEDPFRKYVSEVTAAVLNVDGATVQDGLTNTGCLAAFLGSPSVLVLRVRAIGPSISEAKFHCSTFSDDGDASFDRIADVFFFKMEPIPFGARDFYNLLSISTFHGDEADSFAPLLESQMDPTSLASVISDGHLSSQISNDATQLSDSLKLLAVEVPMDAVADFSRIASLAQEFELWSEYAAQSPRWSSFLSTTKDSLESVLPLESDLPRKDAEKLAKKSVLYDFLSQLLQNKDLYTLGRFEHTTELVTKAFVRSLISDDPPSLWSDPFPDIKDYLNSILDACSLWFEQLETLMSYSGSECLLEPLKGFMRRVRAILSIRGSIEDLTKILPPSELRTRCENPFQMFQGGNYLCHFSGADVSLSFFHFPQERWDSALYLFQEHIGPLKEVAVNHLKILFNSLTNSPLQLLQAFVEFGSLVSSGKDSVLSIKDSLLQEREKLLETLDIFVEEIERDVHDDKYPSALYLTQPASEIVNPRQTADRISQIRRQSEPFVRDLPGFNSFNDRCSRLERDCTDSSNSRFRSWQDTVESLISHHDLSVSDNDFIEIDKNGLVNTTFTTEMLSFLREVRTLQTFHFSVSSDAQASCKSIEKAYSAAVLFNRVSTFYNSLSTRLIPSHKRILLGDLIEFEKKVLACNKSEFSKTRKPLAVAKELQTAADALESKIRTLEQLHKQIGSGIVRLMNTDRLLRRDEWFRIYHQVVRQINGYHIQNVVDETGKIRNVTLTWQTYWDRQLYKALEVTYQMSLVSMNKKITNIEVSLDVDSSGKLFTYPSLEEVREVYYAHMKAIINFPREFTGCRQNPGFFYGMVGTNGVHMVQAYEKAEQLMDELFDWMSSMLPYTVLHQTSKLVMKSQIESEVHTVEEFRAKFGEMKQMRRSLDEIESVHKIDCFTVNLKRLKVAIFDKIKEIEEILVQTLKTMTISDFDGILKFLSESISVLRNLPQNMDLEKLVASQNEIGQIETRRNQNRDLLKNNRAFRAILEEQHSSLADINDVLIQIKTDWKTFDGLFKQYQAHLEEQSKNISEYITETSGKLETSISGFKKEWDTFKSLQILSWDEASLENVLQNLDRFVDQLKSLRTQSDRISRYCEQFNLPIPPNDILNELEGDLPTVFAAWNVYKSYNKEEAELGANHWIVKEEFRKNIDVIEDFAKRWMKTASDSGLSNICYNRIFSLCDLLSTCCTPLKFCKGDVPFERDHWTELFRFLGIPTSTRPEELCVSHFLAVLPKLKTSLDFCKTLTSRATGEVRIREAMEELERWCVSYSFELLEHTELKRTTHIVNNFKDLFTALGDNQSLLGSLKGNEFFQSFEQKGLVLDQQMIDLDGYLHSLYQIQRRWLYLEPIFGRGALPEKQALFKKIDTQFVTIMRKLHSNTRVFSLTSKKDFPGLKEQLESMVQELEQCQKALSDFLEEKRARMPRFYFIGDDDLLEIIGQSQNPAVIQAHLKKLYQGIHKVEFSQSNDQILSMNSVCGEVVPLKNAIKIRESVESWLNDLSKEMVDTLAALLVDISKSDTVLDKYPSQILGLIGEIRFAQACEKAIKEGSLESYRSVVQESLKEYSTLDLTNDPLTRLKVKSLILDLIHQRDVVGYLIQESVNSIISWEWSKQLRFYLTNDKCVCVMVNAQFAYTYEYQGNTAKLVHTPLTDKCYLTLTQGMHQGYGGNPYGPAGTGKTESVKALGTALGRQVLVFNCDEGIDFQSMGRIFIGLVQCGAWGCFDEFNRLKEDQLSAISQQIQIIQAAIKDKERTIVLLNKTIPVDHNSGIFVTMNPAGRGYGGRSKLPDNLKQLFRPVAMSKPDNDLIAESILQSEGFTFARDLGHKVVSIFTLGNELLSPQQHYDWGLRAMKAVLVTGGRLIQEARSKEKNLTEQKEMEILIKAIRVNILPKLTFSDAQQFQGVLGDVFPGCLIQDISFKQLEAAIQTVMETPEFNLEHNSGQSRKMLQLKESLDQRMGCIIVGPCGCGKTTLWQILKRAMVQCGQKIVTHVMNPKSISREMLLGYMDLDTREWHDGVLTQAARQVVKEDLSVHSWIVCDGDIDPEWIESLNSVLDDNHLLTLPNGERINFGSNVNFLFETHDLQYASPATISRMGLIFMSDEDVDIERLVRVWIRTQPERNRSSLEAWMNELFIPAFDYVLSLKAFVVETTKVGVVKSCFSHLNGCSAKGEFISGLVKGLGSNFLEEKREKFARYLFEISHERVSSTDNYLNIHFEGDNSLVYKTQEPDYPLTLKDCFRRAVIPIASLQRNYDMVKPWVNNMEPFIVVGPEGCGKNLLIRYAFDRVRGCTLVSLSCNSATTSTDVIKKLSQSCSLASTSGGRVYRPKEGDRLVLYLRDINLPKPDRYNTCMLVAFLQQLLTFNGFYNEDLEFLGLDRIQIVVSINPSTTLGRAVLSTRFTAIARIAYIHYPSDEELQTIYSNYLLACFAGIDLREEQFKRKETCMQLSQTLVAVYTEVRSKFSIDDSRHYLFTPRDLTKIVLGLIRYDTQAESVLDVCVHEFQRQFRDRIVDEESASRFDSIVEGLFSSQWKYNGSIRECFFTTLGSHDAQDTSLDGSRTLRRVPAEDFLKAVQTGINRFEKEEAALGLAVVPEVLSTISQMDRILSQKGGNILLVGESGVGRRTLVTLVSHMAKYVFFAPSISREFGFANLAEQLKEPFRKAGVDCENVVLFIDDIRLEQPSVMDAINSFLSSGEIPGMYKPDELGELSSALKDSMTAASASGADGGNAAIRTPLDLFVYNLQQNLHVVLSMNPKDPNFLNNCESHPGFTTATTIMWLGTWKDQTMESFPRLLIPDLVRAYPKEGELERLIIEVHRSAKANPRDFMCFIKSYQTLYNWKHDQIQQEINHLKMGLQKLQEASKSVDVLSKDAEQQKQQISESQREADSAMVDITRTLEDAGETRLNVEELQSSLAAEEKEILARKGKIEQEFNVIKPQMDAAKKAVSGIKPDNLNEVKSLQKPPEPIVDVLSAVLKLLGNQDTSWNSMKIFLGDRSVLNRIINFNPDQLTPEVRDQCQRIVKSRSASFEPDVIRRVSIAAAPMAAWVKANLQFSSVMEKVEPLRNELAKAESALSSSREKLDKNKRELAKIDEKVNGLKQKFAAKTREAEELKSRYLETEATLSKAQKLLGQLSGEQERWKEKAGSLSGELETLFKRMLCAAGYITYMGHFSEDRRESLLKQWYGITEISSFLITRTLCTESDSLLWKSRGLPSDVLSLENAIIILQSTHRVPFIIDPSGVSSHWLEEQLKISAKPTIQVTVLNSQDPRFTNQVDLAVRFGKTLIIRDAEGVEAMLYPLVKRHFSQQGSRRTVLIGEHSVDFHEDFLLYISTRNPHPVLPPDAQAIITEVNFTVTRSGLEGQLLGVTIQHEQPDLEHKKSEMLKKEEDLKVELASLEKLLLETLAESKGNLLENTVLISSLTETKSKSADIAVALEESAKSSLELDTERNTYRPFAQEGSKLYFLVQNMVHIDHMYQFSLKAFIALVQSTLEEKIEFANTTSKRIEFLIPLLVSKVLFYVSRSLFKSHQLLWALYVIHGMRPDLFGPNEWEVFTGEIIPDPSQISVRDIPAWVSSDCHGMYSLLKNQFKQLYSTCNFTGDGWKAWSTASDCERSFPPKVARKLSLFQRILLLQALRPDHLLTGLTNMAAEILQVSSINPPPFNVKEIYEQNPDRSVPVLIITTAGADPSESLREFATTIVGKERFHELAMGGGQQESALALLLDAATKGHWLVLKNLHLVVTWLPVLEKAINGLTPHKDFRLWLTTESHSEFAPNLLQQSYKITLESPPGIKKNLMQSLDAWKPESVRDYSPTRMQLMFLLSWLHAIIQERRTYLPQGWSTFYEFSASDLRTGYNIIHYFLDQDESKLNFKAIRGLLELSVYGNRISNPFDLKVLSAFIRQLFNPEMLKGGNLSGQFCLPQTNILGDYYKNVSSLKDNDVPQIFGLPPNIERSVQRVVSGAIVETLQQLSMVDRDASIFDKQKWKALLEPLFALWQSMTGSNSAVLTAQKNPFSEKDRDPIQNFLSLEYEKVHSLVMLINKSFRDLKDIIGGQSLLTPQMSDLANSLLAGLVPSLWYSLWEGPEKVQSWLSGVVQKKVALAALLDRAAGKSGLLSSPIQLTSFLHPGTFLRALCQQTARSLHVPLDISLLLR